MTMLATTHNFRGIFFAAVSAGALLIVSPAFAGAAKEIQLKDGSVLHAEILSYANGVYQLKSDALGKFSLADEKIRTIQSADSSSARGETTPKHEAAPAPKNLGNGPADTRQLQQKMLNDPEAMRLIQELQADPQVQQILTDPELMKAINQGDLGRVSSDSKIQALQNNKKLGDLLDRNR
jgi:hypothetical protein